MYQPHFLLLWILSILQNDILLVSAATNVTSAALSRSKRLIYYTSENRFTLPPGSLVLFDVGFLLPSLRNVPPGFKQQMSINIPFTIIFDDLGYTSEENPWGRWPDSFADIELGIAGRKKRKAWQSMEGVNWAGGDREMVFQVVEDYISFFGMKGKPCLLRAICETFETPLIKHGLVGEILKLVFSVSNSIGAAERLADYLEAEKMGKKHKSCSKYYAECKKSLFTHNAQRKIDKHMERFYHNSRREHIDHSEHQREAMEKVQEILDLENMFRDL